MRIDPDREVAIKAERQPRLLPGLGRGAELAVGFPLQPLKEIDSVGKRLGEFGDRRRMRITHRGRPFVPRERQTLLREMLMQSLEDCEIGERSATRELELAKGDPQRALCVECLETAEQRFEHRPLQRRDGGVIDQLGGARRGDRRLRREGLRRGVLRKARHGGDIDVKKIEPDAARWRIRAEVPRLGREEGVQRVDPDRRRAEPSGGARQPGQIGEIADPPITAAAQTIELRGQPPAAPARLQCLWQMTR